MNERCKCCGQLLPPEELPPDVQLTKVKSQIWQAVVAWPGSSSKEITDWIFGHDPNGGPNSENNVRVHIMQMNKQLREHGLEISGHRTEGYRVKYLAPSTPRAF
jgi:hypothetical protein